MDGAQAPDKVSAVNPHDFAIRKQCCENIQSMAIVGIVKGRHRHQPVGDIKIGVARGQPLSAEDDGAWQRQFDDLEGTATVADLKKGARITGAQRDKLATDLKKKYEKGASIRALAESTGRSYGFVHRVLSETGVTLRGRGGATRTKKK